jgi:hypothetical protein
MAFFNALAVSFIFSKFIVELTQRPTVCVTCAGAGTAKPSSQKNGKA